jgi:hypothetical protein
MNEASEECLALTALVQVLTHGEGESPHRQGIPGSIALNVGCLNGCAEKKP